jgi:glycosyltransferase involved in cell wall biosynthesis
MRRTFGAVRAAGRWAAIAVARPARGEVAVSYGHRRVPAPGERVEGGMVKFQRLQGTFPNRPRDFNLLYLGSSTLPRDERTLVRLAARRGAAVVLNQNGVAYAAWAGGRADELNARLRGVLRAAGHVLYQSRFCKDAADRFLGEPQATWEVLPNAVDTTAFVPADRAPAAGPVLLLAGDQFQPYRLPTALRALALLPEARLLVTGQLVGDGRRTIRELGLEARVDLVGPYTQYEAPGLYRRAHVLLHPKVNDPCPNVVLEAMACGLPVVYSATGGTPELVGDAGVGVPSETTWERDVPPAPEELAEGVRTVLARHEEYRERARARAVERFDLAPWLERHRTLFSRLVEE